MIKIYLATQDCRGVTITAKNWTIEASTAFARFHGARAHEYACDAWACAAGAHGAYAPRHIAAVMTEQTQPDLIAAVTEGTKRALDQHDSDSCPPRGCDVEIKGGRAVAIVWRSEGHSVTLRPDFEGYQWTVEIDCHGKPAMRSPRVWAALLDAPLELEFHADSGAVYPVETVDLDWPIPGVIVDGVEGTTEHDRDIMLYKMEGQGTLVIRGHESQSEPTPPPIRCDGSKAVQS